MVSLIKDGANQVQLPSFPAMFQGFECIGIDGAHTIVYDRYKLWLWFSNLRTSCCAISHRLCTSGCRVTCDANFELFQSQPVSSACNLVQAEYTFFLKLHSAKELVQGHVDKIRRSTNASFYFFGSKCRFENACIDPRQERITLHAVLSSEKEDFRKRVQHEFFSGSDTKQKQGQLLLW